jgi:glycosyltransferase involved in cell wall biosynthesis
MWHMLSVIIPACNEEDYIHRCLTALFASDDIPGGAEVVVVANGCRDATAQKAHSFAAQAAAKHWGFQVLDLPTGGKPNALNQGDLAASGELRVYLDADCTVSAPLMAQLVAALNHDHPLYAGATPVVPLAKSWVTRAYARFWQKLPFARSVAPGYGLFAVNQPARARWAEFPPLISDDTFVRLQFTPKERVQVQAPYDWPMIEGFGALTRVRRRQDLGVAEIDAKYPGLLAREGKAPLTLGHLCRLALADPLGFGVYVAVSLNVRRQKGTGAWTRGR